MPRVTFCYAGGVFVRAKTLKLLPPKVGPALQEPPSKGRAEMRFLLALLVLSTPALALNRHRIAVLKDPSANQGARIDPETGTVAATPAQLRAPPTYVGAHSARVANDLTL